MEEDRARGWVRERAGGKIRHQKDGGRFVCGINFSRVFSLFACFVFFNPSLLFGTTRSALPSSGDGSATVNVLWT